MKKQGSAAPRGRPFIANDPRANRKGRPRKYRSIKGDLLDIIADAASDGGNCAACAAVLGLVANAKARASLVPRIPEETSPEELDQVTANMRRLGMLPPLTPDLGKLFDQDRSAALAMLPEHIARCKLGLFDQDDARGWPSLEQYRPTPKKGLDETLET